MHDRAPYGRVGFGLGRSLATCRAGTLPWRTESSQLLLAEGSHASDRVAAGGGALLGEGAAC
jgi:hypothetical protein